MEYLDGTGLGILWNRIKTYIQSLNYTSNIGTVTGITMNNTSYSPVNGDVDIGTVVTDVSSKANDSEVVHTTGDETIAGDKTFTGTITGVDIYGDLYGGVYTSWAEIEHGIIVPPVNGNSGTLTLVSANDGNAQLVVGNSQGNPEGGTLEEQATGGWTQLYNSVTDKTLLDELDERNNVQPDWSQTTTTAADYIKNKPTIPAAQIQADWSLTTTTSLDYIKNKPDITQVNNPVKQITISGQANSVVVGDDVSIGRNNSKIEIGSSGGDNETIRLTTSGSDGGVYVSTGTQKFYYNNNEVATKNDIPTVYAWAQAATKPSYTAADVGAVPATRTVNGKALSADITLSASDVSALPSSTVIPSAPGTLNTTATTAQSTSSSEALSGNVTLHKVAKTGAYSDLIGTPTIPTISTDIISDGIDDTKTASPKAVKTFVEGKGYLTSETEPDFNGSAAATITSSDISNWNGKTSNVGTVTSVTVNGSTYSPTNGDVDLGTIGGGGTQVQADWNQSDNSEPDYIKNKPTNLVTGINSSGTATAYTVWIGTQQQYDDILTKSATTLYFIKGV